MGVECRGLVQVGGTKVQLNDALAKVRVLWAFWCLEGLIL